VDDFIGMLQGNPVHCQHVKHIFLSSLDEVLRQLDNQDNIHRQELASVKNVLKGDATWVTLNIVLGWLLDTCTITVQLTPHRVARLFEILDYIAPKQHRTTVNKRSLEEMASSVCFRMPFRPSAIRALGFGSCARCIWCYHTFGGLLRT
jgi:hypothetical protein